MAHSPPPRDECRDLEPGVTSAEWAMEFNLDLLRRHSFLFLCEFCEFEGAVTRATFPAGVHFKDDPNPDDSLRKRLARQFISSDHCSESGDSSFRLSRDASFYQEMLVGNTLDESQLRSQLTLHCIGRLFKLYDVHSRGNVRAYCVTFVTHSREKMLLLNSSLEQRLQAIVNRIRTCNLFFFLHQIRQFQHNLRELELWYNCDQAPKFRIRNKEVGRLQSIGDNTSFKPSNQNQTHQLPPNFFDEKQAKTGKLLEQLTSQLVLDSGERDGKLLLELEHSCSSDCCPRLKPPERPEDCDINRVSVREFHCLPNFEVLTGCGFTSIMELLEKTAVKFNADLDVWLLEQNEQSSDLCLTFGDIRTSSFPGALARAIRRMRNNETMVAFNEWSSKDSNSAGSASMGETASLSSSQASNLEPWNRSRSTTRADSLDYHDQYLAHRGDFTPDLASPLTPDSGPPHGLFVHQYRTLDESQSIDITAGLTEEQLRKLTEKTSSLIPVTSEFGLVHRNHSQPLSEDGEVFNQDKFFALFLNKKSHKLSKLLASHGKARHRNKSLHKSLHMFEGVRSGALTGTLYSILVGNPVIVLDQGVAGEKKQIEKCKPTDTISSDCESLLNALFTFIPAYTSGDCILLTNKSSVDLSLEDLNYNKMKLMIQKSGDVRLKHGLRECLTKLDVKAGRVSSRLAIKDDSKFLKALVNNCRDLEPEHCLLYTCCWLLQLAHAANFYLLYRAFDDPGRRQTASRKSNDTLATLVSSTFDRLLHRRTEVKQPRSGPSTHPTCFVGLQSTSDKLLLERLSQSVLELLKTHDPGLQLARAGVSLPAVRRSVGSGGGQTGHKPGDELQLIR